MPDSSSYVGDELEIFAGAHKWKRYLRETLRPHVRGDVLEVGAGIGATTAALREGGIGRWTCLEPDARFTEELQRRVTALPNPELVQVMIGSMAALALDQRFDTVLYVDVLEHIADDVNELRRAYERLRPGGRIVVLAPAHQFLFTPFDSAIGHYRRYDRRSLRALAPQDVTLERCVYLDSVGMLASLANRLLLRQKMPTHAQIGFWDRVLVPCSRRIDSMLGYRLGKSVLAVWRRPGSERHRGD